MCARGLVGNEKVGSARTFTFYFTVHVSPSRSKKVSHFNVNVLVASLKWKARLLFVLLSLTGSKTILNWKEIGTRQQLLGKHSFIA